MKKPFPDLASGEAWFEELTKINNELTNARRELSKSQAELERLAAVKDRFLQITSHDLRSPLADTLAGIELLSGEAGLDAAKRRAYLARMRDNLEFMLSLVEDILDTAAIESGALRLAPEDIDLVVVVGETIRSFEPLAAKRGIQISFEPGEESFTARADPVRLRQAIGNLLSNAVKFSPEGGMVTLALLRSGASIALRVGDQGPGIRGKELETLFSPYATLAARTPSGEKNTGLGLFIAKSIAAAHGGELGIESEAGRGTVLELRIPAPGLK